MDLSILIIIAIVLLIAAGITIYLVTRKKVDKLARRAFVNQCRFVIDQQFTADTFGNTLMYKKLRPNLKRSLRKQLEPVNGTGLKTQTGEEDRIKKDLLEVLSKLERKWGI